LKNFNGYALFDNIRDTNLRTYNRINVYLNVKERHGPDVGRSYLKQFKKNEMLEIYSMMSEMHRVGFEQFRRDFMRNAA
jgi:hypothetical protein